MWNTVLGFSPNMTEMLRDAMNSEGYVLLRDWMQIDADAIRNLEYVIPNDDDEDAEPERAMIQNAHATHLLAFRYYCVYWANTNGRPPEASDVMTFTEAALDAFMFTGDYQAVAHGIHMPHGQAGGVRPASDPLKEFKKGIKRDPSIYTVIKTESAFDEWRRVNVPIAETHDVGDVLKPEFRPDPADVALFQEKQIFVYSVFNRVLQTPKSHLILAEHEATRDAQKVYAEFSEFCTKSTRAKTDASNLLRWIMAAKYDTAKFKGRTHDFITYWQNQVHLHASRVKREERIHPAIKMASVLAWVDLVQNSENSA